MSHLTHIKTRFQNLFYLEKALSRLNIAYKKKVSTEDISTILVISQSNHYDLEFSWNGEEYELLVDESFWNQSSPIKTYMDRISKEYATEAIIGETQKIGFQPVRYQQNYDGSNSLFLERWGGSGYDLLQ